VTHSRAICRIAAAIVLLAPCSISGPSWAFAQTSKVSVYVAQSGDDAVGQSFTYAVREEIRRSAAYEIGTEDRAVFTIDLVSVDLAYGDSPKGYGSAVAVSYSMRNSLPYQAGNPQTWLPLFLSLSVLTVGRDAISNQARYVVAGLDKQVEGYRSAMRR
jgi:hypothetical protein